ncbi:DNA-binding response regulator, NarL/FixJ family, contains REC and HTH domains [Nonomuraea solani]|uniref:DNA-binding response regulator, NarL/FixJ family, contains REC and HTH domains n=2 Tax=Nonomuraea solani TaxID=1144553 RepID=A0A1H6F2A1_9ACTN|nr:DNA-binding response regulator, NarL/FixJ family, contains REC and HTH domains [Nonomuraea solani]
MLLVDDHPVFRAGLRGLLAAESWVGEIFEAATVAEAVRIVVTHDVRVVAMDIRLPDGDGIAATARIVKVRPHTAVLLLTMVEDEYLVAAGLRAGARGYVLKQTDPRTVVTTLRTVADGGVALGPRIGSGVLAALRRAPSPPPPPFDRLTPRERELVQQVAGGLGNGPIARALGVSEKTVRNMVSEVLAKLQIPDRVRLALMARDAGLAPERDLDH